MSYRIEISVYNNGGEIEGNNNCKYKLEVENIVLRTKSAKELYKEIARYLPDI